MILRLSVLLRLSTPREWGLVALAVVYAVLGWSFSAALGLSNAFSVFLYGATVLKVTLLLAVLFIGWVCFRIMLVERPRKLTRRIVEEIRERWLHRDRLARAIPPVLAFVVFIGVFTSLKTMIPAVQPYAWDSYFMTLDRAFHFGIDPWKLLHPLMGYPVITFITNVVYNLWFVVMFAILYWQAFTRADDALRLRFFYTFLLTWMINGTVLAMLFSSAGPCYYERVLGDHYYAPLMEYLARVNEIYPVWALKTQDMLWAVYQDNRLSIGSGISAMPSVHVAAAFLFMVLGWRSHKAIGILLSIFFAFILFGSVHLGWHYAVDGYLGVIVTVILWRSLRFVESSR